MTYISQTLDERAREDLFRLKKVKKKIETKKRGSSERAERIARCDATELSEPLRLSSAAARLSGRRRTEVLGQR